MSVHDSVPLHVSPAFIMMSAAILPSLMTRRWLLLFGLSLLTTSGCQWNSGAMLDVGSALEDWQWFKPDTEPQVPDRMMAVWSDTILHQPRKPGVRGFGGRIYFYRGQQPEPIEVDGGLVVYAFDSDSPRSSSTKPEKKYVFTADQFAEHMSHTEMGPSYSVWLPWDQIGGPNRKLSLIARFEGRQGGVVLSKPSSKLLPGVASVGAAQEPADHTQQGGIAQVGGERDSLDSDEAIRQATQWELPATQSRPAGVEPSERRSAITIDLPSNFQRHLMGAVDSPERRRSTTSDANDSVPASRVSAEDLRGSPPINGGPESLRSSPGEAGELGADQSDLNETPRNTLNSSEPTTLWQRFSGRPQRHRFRQPATAESISQHSDEALRRPASWMAPIDRTRRQSGTKE